MLVSGQERRQVLVEGDAEPEQALAVGDTPYDAQAALRTGVRTMGVLSGSFPEGELRGAGCVAVYGSIEELQMRYETSPLRAGQG